MICFRALHVNLDIFGCTYEVSSIMWFLYVIVTLWLFALSYLGFSVTLKR